MAYGIFRKVTTLEFFQHHFAKSGHGDGLLMTRQLISTFRQPPLHYLTRSVRRTSGFVLVDNSETIVDSHARVAIPSAKWWGDPAPQFASMAGFKCGFERSLTGLKDFESAAPIGTAG